MERRLAAIIAADVVGYTRLMGEDEASTLAALKMHRRELIDPKAVQYNGRTIKLMGDGALMEFASVVDAVNFAVEVQCAMRERNADIAPHKQILLRIGINIGDVIVEGDDIYGDGVNVAARLEGFAEPGGICVRRNVRNQIRDKLDLNFDDLGEIEVKNIERPIRTFRVVLDAKATALVTPVSITPVSKRLGGRSRIAAGLVLAIVTVAGLAWWQPWTSDVEPASIELMALPLPSMPSVAVLPFDNLSDDAEQGYFADGITEDLITDLSKISALFVIARNSSFAYRAKQVSIRQVAEDLGVRYVLEGSVRRTGERVRINAQLIDAVTGGHLWAERYDGTLGDIFAFQDQVTGSIVAALAVNLTGPEMTAQAASTTADPQAYDALLRGLSYFRRSTPDDFAQAVSYFGKAISLDPDYSRAYSARAAVYAVAVEYNRLGATTLWSRQLGLNTDAAIVEIGRNLEQAFKVPDPLTHQVASGRLSFIGQHENAIAEAERAIRLDPNDPAGHKALASARIFAGRPSEAIGEIRLAMRLDPHHSSNYLFWVGLAQFSMERFEDSAKTLTEAVQSNPDDERNMIVLASAFGHLGQMVKARNTIEIANRIRIERQARLEDPNWQAGVDVFLVGTYSLSDVDWWPFKERADRERLRDGLRLAGVPEAGAGENVSPSTVSGATTVDAALAKDLHAGGAAFVDVRGAASWNTGHIPGAVHLDLKTHFTEAKLTAVVAKDRQVVIYCAGPRCLLSSEACVKAVAWGFKQVYYFREGFPAWKAAGYLVETPK